MEDNVDIINLVLAKLDSEDIWFTSKLDPTIEEASSYYQLDEYGEPTEKTVKKIEKEVLSLIGDGAVDIVDAVELWKNDQLCAFRLDFKDNLVTKYADKPVVDNIEAYENPVQFPQSKKVENKKIIEGILKNIQFEDEVDDWKVYTADIDTLLGKDIISTFKDYEDDDNNVITNIRIDYNTSDDTYIVNYVDNNGRFHQIDYKLSDDELAQVNGIKKTEAKTKKTENKVFSALNELNASNFVELKDEIEKLFDDEIINDDQYNKFIDIIDEEENKCEDYLRRRSKVTNTDWKDELAIESDYVVSTLQMLIDEVTDLFENKKVDVKTKKTEYYKMPDDEHIIWDSEVDYYDEDYMEDIKQNQYQDYLDDFEPSEPLSYEDWLDSEECYDEHYYMFEQSGLTDWEDVINEYEDNFKEDYDDYVAYYKDEPLPFDKWYSNYIQDASYDDWEYLEDDLKSNIFPEIDKQVNDDVLILSGYYGSNYPDFKSSGAGGKLFEKGTKDFRDYMGNFDRVCITTQNGILGAVLGDHDGTVSGQFFTLPDDKSELFKALDLENKVKEDYADQEIDWENETVGEYDSIGNYRNYDLEDLIEKEFYELLEYGGLEARDFTAHIELLKPIKDTISGYANKSKHPEIKEEAKFKDKVKAIKKSLKKNDKRLSDKTAEKSAEKIAGSMIKKEDKQIKTEKSEMSKEDIKNLLDNGNIIKVSGKTGYTPTKFLEKDGKIYFLNREITWGAFIPHSKNINEMIDYIFNLQKEGFKITSEDWDDKVKIEENKITENYQKRLNEVNTKSETTLNDMITSSDFDSDSKAGQIVIRTQELFNVLSDMGYDVDVAFDNGESTSSIQLGTLGGKVVITITDTDKPLRAFISGNFEITDDNLKIFKDIEEQLTVL